MKTPKPKTKEGIDTNLILFVITIFIIFWALITFSFKMGELTGIQEGKLEVLKYIVNNWKCP